MDLEVDRFDLVARGALYLPAAILLWIAARRSRGDESGSRVATARAPDPVAD
jgi:hypothetical protein